MALVRGSEIFRVFPAKHAYKQKVKLKPIEHHCENEGEEPQIKYGCRLCEQLIERSGCFFFKEDEKFSKFSFPEGTEQCPCCGINIDWGYREEKSENIF